MKRELSTGWTMTMLVATLGSGLSGHSVLAQGCEPIRFTTPIDLGGEGQAYQAGRQWRLTVAYRRLHSSDWFVGTEENSALAPGGQSPVFNIHTVVGDLAYSVTDRFRVRLSVPFSTGRVSAIRADKLLHDQTASGIGDVNLSGEAWLRNPKNHENGNVSVGLGIKVPTGSHTKASQFFTATGPVPFPADQTIQPGDGGWAVSLQAQAFRRVAEGLFVYGFGSYMASPKEQTEVRFNPTSTIHWSVPDVYSTRLGAAFSVWPDKGLTMSLGARMDGIPKRDLFGGGDSTTIKRTSRIIFADPGLSLRQGRSTFMLSVPVRVSVNRMKSLFEARTNGLNAGGFAKYLVFASVSYRL